MSDQQVPTAPNYGPLISAFQSISDAASQHGTDALNWAKDQVANNKGLVDTVNKGLLDTQTAFSDFGKSAVEKGQGLVDDATGYLKDVRSRFTDPTRQASDMGAAEANVGQAFDAARNASTQALEGYGVNPGAVRFGALDIGTRVQQAASQASAGTTAARADEARADAADQALLTAGQTGLASGINLTAQGNASGTGAVQNTLANTASGYQGLGTGLAWTTPQTSALTGATSATNTGFTNQAEADKIANSSSSGLGSLLGAGLGAMGKGGALAEGGALAFLAEGGVVPEGGLPTGNPTGNPQGAPQGSPQGAIPMDASPSNGAVTDDVPASGPSGAIRLNGGEFVIPKDVVSWEGEKSLQNLIAKARKGKEGAQAKPTVGPAPAQQAPQGAIPMGA